MVLKLVPCDHRTMVRDQRGEGQLGRLAMPGFKPVEELAIGQAGDRAGVEQRLKALMRGAGAAARARHASSPHSPECPDK